MTIAPWLFEALVVAVMGLSGIGLGILVGWRHPLLLASMAVLVASSVRVTTALATWTLGQYSFLQEAWWVTSVLLAVGGLWAGLRLARRNYLTALAVYAGVGVASLAVKYVFAIGERHHRDSSSTVETALLVFQRELEPQLWDPSEKRGLAYPMMLALGPDERMLSAVTPLVFFSLILLSWWLAREFLRTRIPMVWQVVAGVAVLAFSLTVPIFRVSLTYLNSHTLMALALLAMMAGYLLAERDGRITLPTAAMMVVGSLMGSTSRVEGIVFVAVVLAAIVSGRSVTGLTGRIGVFLAVAASGCSLAWWLHQIGSDVPDQFGVPLWLVALATTLAAAVVVVPLLDRVRWIFFPLAATIIAAVIINVSLSAANPLDPFMGLFNNVVRGYGGWGVAASALALSLLLLGWRARSWQYRKLASILVVMIFAALFAKLFDGGEFGGGFGRDSFYDSANRMWLHTLGIAMTAMVIGFAEFFRDVSDKLRPVRDRKAATADYTSNTVSVSKDSQS
jgi:hypothetical protein